MLCHAVVHDITYPDSHGSKAPCRVTFWVQKVALNDSSCCFSARQVSDLLVFASIMESTLNTVLKSARHCFSFCDYFMLQVYDLVILLVHTLCGKRLDSWNMS